MNIKIQKSNLKQSLLILMSIFLYSSSGLPTICAQEAVALKENISEPLSSVQISYAEPQDKDFILLAHREINGASNLTKTAFEQNIDEDLFGKYPKCTCLVAKIDGKYVGMCLYAGAYRTTFGWGIYISQVYTDPDFRGKGLFGAFANTIKNTNTSAKFVTCLVDDKNESMTNGITKLGFEKYDLGVYYLEINNEQNF